FEQQREKFTTREIWHRRKFYINSTARRRSENLGNWGNWQWVGPKLAGRDIRVQLQQKKQLTKPPIPAQLGFNDEDDDDYVERDIMRQAYINKIRKDTEEQQKKTLEQGPLAFDYDGVYMIR
ncbi:hypothetical protein MIMGU_mgv11b017783mg, partial [Erythranthe guttata]